MEYILILNEYDNDNDMIIHTDKSFLKSIVVCYQSSNSSRTFLWR